MDTIPTENIETKIEPKHTLRKILISLAIVVLAVGIFYAISKFIPKFSQAPLTKEDIIKKLVEESKNNTTTSAEKAQIIQKLNIESQKNPVSDKDKEAIIKSLQQ